MSIIEVAESKSSATLNLGDQELLTDAIDEPTKQTQIPAALDPVDSS